MILRKLVLLTLLAIGGVYAYYRWGPLPNPLLPTIGRLESQVLQSLSAAGITDAHIISHRREEKSCMGLGWVEIRRTVAVPRAERRKALAQLESLAKRRNLGLTRQTSVEENLTLTLKKYGLPLQRVTLTTPPPPAPPPPPAAPLVSRTPRAAIVIDDVGYSLETMDRYAALGVPLTMAILPGDRRAPALSTKAQALKFTVIMHLPLEPVDMTHHNPGSAGLFRSMTETAMQQQFEKALARVPGLVGLNNHMGSAFTADEVAMTRLLGWVKQKNLFFLDSRTSPASVAVKVAKRLGVPCLVNHTFLDNEDDQEAIEHQLDHVMRLALKYKQTVAIGHYRRKHLVAALERKLPEFKEKGIELVGLSALVRK